MKKKRNFLTIISSILGVFTICSFCMFSIFSRSDKKANGVKAAQEFVTSLYFNDSYTNYASNGLPYKFNGSLSLVRDINESTGEVSYSSTLTYNFEVTSSTLGTLKSTNPIVEVFKNPNFNPDDTFSFYVYWVLIDTKVDNTHFKGRINNRLSPVENWVSTLAGGTQFEFTLSQAYTGTASQLNTQLQYAGSQIVLQPPSTNYAYILENVSYGVTAYTLGFDDGYQAGFVDGNTAGYTNGYNQGQNDGYNQGYQAGVDSQQVNIDNSYQQGYSDGYSAADSQDVVVTSIFSGILQVAMVPVNFFLSIFNFEILGINLSAFIRAIFTVVLTIIVIKTVMGKGGGGSDN